jgi:LuxR family maltose regulon positive regulatory protein
VTTAIPARRVSRGPAIPIVEPLSEREIEVLILLDRRLTNKEIAAQLGISPLTVRTHTRNIYRKLDVNSRRQACAVAKSLGIIPPG